MVIQYSSDMIQHASEGLIHINSCGELRLTTDSHIIRSRGRKDYQLIYMEHGCCYVRIKGEELTANSGDCIIYRPGEVQDYLFLAKDDPHTYWIHFSGNICSRLFAQLSLDGVHIVRGAHNRDLEYLVAGICKYFNLKEENYPLICSGMMTSVLALCSNHLHGNDMGNKRDGSKNAHLISELISRFKLMPNMKMEISECARFCKISQSHFCRIFKEITGQSPQQYIINVRIDRAKELLTFTEHSVAQIAEATGFEDQNYFARVFKKKVGMTPSDYRREKYGRMAE